MVDMSLDAVTARLHEMARLSRDAPPRKAVDMSSEAVTARLRTMASLSAMCLRLGAIGRENGLGGSAACKTDVQIERLCSNIVRLP